MQRRETVLIRTPSASAGSRAGPVAYAPGSDGPPVACAPGSDGPLHDFRGSVWQVRGLPCLFNRQITKSPNHQINPLPDGRGSDAPPVACAPGSDSRRRGSVLVLVMTLLGILFVLGVAFLATMNFEADMIASQRQRDRSDNGVAAAAIDVGSMLRDAMMAAPGLPFGDTSVALSSTAYAEMPGVQNASSPVEPIRTAGPDGIFFNGDDEFVFNSYFDVKALRNKPFTGPSLPPGFTIDSRNANNTEIPGYTLTFPGSPTPVPINLRRCTDGPFKGQKCGVSADCQINPTDPPYACEGPRVADADGDGIVDSLLVAAADIGLSGPQLTELAARVNPASNPTGRVSIALRVIPHGSMVNLNDSHPNLIENVLGIPPGTLKKPPDPNLGNFFHGPTQLQTLYSPLLEESLLRRRALLPPAAIPSSTLHGNALDKTANTTRFGDMAWYLYPPKWPGGAVAGNYETVFDHRSTPISPTELSPAGDPNLNLTLWSVRMEPFTSQTATPGNTAMPEYDRRHLVTTVSQDDLLVRSAMVSTPVGPKDLRQAMIAANQSAWDPNQCPPVLPFEYADYPPFIKNETDPQLTTSPYDKCECPTDLYCRFDPRKGRLQVSLPWIDDALAAAGAITDPVLREESRQRVFHTIHDAFFMLVRNAAAPLKVEGMLCSTDADCPVRDTVCRLSGAAPAPSQQGYCVHLGNANINNFTNPNATGGPGCQTAAQCAISGSMCNAGVCELAAPAWRDKECANDADCNPPGAPQGEQFCLFTKPSPAPGVCADRWTKQRRSEALIARTAASLTANMIDFADADNVPTRVAIRDFEFIAKCKDGANQNRPCASDADCPGGSCRNLSGRDIDINPTNKDLENFGVYAYGLERQPYITEVATFSETGAQIDARAIELFNPNPLGIPASDSATNEEYFIYEVDPSGTLASAHIATLTGVLAGTASASPGPFTSYYSASNPGAATSILGAPPKGTPIELNGVNTLTFANGWTIYLVRRVVFDPGPPVVYVDVVIDQFNVVGEYIAKSGITPPTPCGPAGIQCIFSLERLVTNIAPWIAPVPWTGDEKRNAATLGDWNNEPNGAIYPVEIQFANTGMFGPHIFSTSASAAFPTTGSLSLLIRYANRAITDFTPPPVGTTAGNVTNLAFTSALLVDPKAGTSAVDLDTTVEDTATMLVPAVPGGPPIVKDKVAIGRQNQIDNGRMPLFDVGAKGTNAATGYLAAHHLPPQLLKAWNPDPTVNDPSRSHSPLPGDLNALPWGQLVFDYFTALPLSNPGPYLVADPDMIGAPESQPRVDREGARVYGRINLNAAPWTVLSGLPFVPMNRIPVGFRDAVRAALGINPAGIPDADAARIGDELAQAIVAYRELRPIGGTGDYSTGMPAITPTPPGPPIAYGRGWEFATPLARRGTGFMSVGELANVRHLGAATITTPPPVAPPKSYYRIDAGVINEDNTDNNAENFIDAAAVLIALGDWATVRSQVFTVYGLIRGEPAAAASNPVQDADSRAIRFQETIDRLPTFFGEPLPRRIGEPTVAKLTDVNND